MKWTVIWVPAAERRLAAIWAQSNRRQAISDAANEVDLRLARAPESEGESRGDGPRVLLVTPLAVNYRIDHDDRLVHVVDVWEFRTPDQTS